MRAAALLLSTLLVACGGGGGIDHPASAENQEESATPADLPNEPTPEAQEVQGDLKAHALAGGQGDTAVFYDRLNISNDVSAVEKATKLSICAGSRVYSYQLTTNQRVFPKHGGTGGTCQTFNFAANEDILRVFGGAGSVIDRLGITTTTGRTFGPFGGAGGKAFSMTVAGGMNGVFRGLSGTEGVYNSERMLAQINLIDDLTGGNGGTAFIDRMLADEKVIDVTICYRTDAYVQSVQLRTNLGNRTKHGTDFGGQPCSVTRLDEGEYIRELFGTADQYVNSLGFVTSTGRRVGPFGGPGGTGFSQTVFANSRFAGWYGRADGWLEKIGLMTQPTGQVDVLTFVDQLAQDDRINKVEVCTATNSSNMKLVRSVRAYLQSGYSLPLNGGRASSNATTQCQQVFFAADEFVTEMFGRSSGIINAVGFRTNKGRDIGPFGGAGGTPFLLRNPSTSAFLGFAGRFMYDGFLATLDFAAPDLFPPVAAPDNTAASTGWWSDMVAWPLVAIHSSFTRDGRLLTYGTDGSGTQGAQLIYDVWNPALGTGRDAHMTLDNTTGTDLFCSAQTLMPDGRILLAGGDNRQLGGYNKGVRDTTFFNPVTNAMESTVKMAKARWYATQTMLPSGRVLVTGGVDENDVFVDVAELYTPGLGWKTLTKAVNMAALGRNYPRVFVPPKVQTSDAETVYLIATGTAKIYRLDVDANGGLGAIADTGVKLPEQHSWNRPATMIAPDKALIQLNGGSTSIVQLPTTAGALPKVIAAGTMSQKRPWSSFVILPTGDVLATGGSSEANQIDVGTVAQYAEIWSPTTRTWKKLAAEMRPRLYHSSSVLMPDGRVMSSGGGAPGPIINLNSQFFSPPYLFQVGGNGSLAARPSIASAPSTVPYNNANFTVETPQAASISRATLVRLASTTHSYDFDQRIVELSIAQRTSSSLTLKGPNNRFTAPPGSYLLTLVNSSGVPSASKIVTLN